jgi:hypothetical protein
MRSLTYSYFKVELVRGSRSFTDRLWEEYSIDKINPGVDVVLPAWGPAGATAAGQLVGLVIPIIPWPQTAAVPNRL